MKNSCDDLRHWMGQYMEFMTTYSGKVHFFLSNHGSPKMSMYPNISSSILHQISGWWLSPTPLKSMKSSMGMMTFPMWKKSSKSQPPSRISSAPACISLPRSWGRGSLGGATPLPWPRCSKLGHRLGCKPLPKQSKTCTEATKWLSEMCFSWNVVTLFLCARDGARSVKNTQG